MADPRIPTGPLEQEPTPLFLPVLDRQWLLYRALAKVRLGAWDQRIVDWLAKSTDTSTLLTILSLIERAKAAERYGAHDREPAVIQAAPIAAWTTGRWAACGGRPPPS